MKNWIVTLITLLVLSPIVAQKMLTRTGVIHFSSETPIEKIEAESAQVASIFEVSDKMIAFNVLMKSFKFDKALMEEHFNEKYVHSDKYPAAKFKGTIIDDLDLANLNLNEFVQVSIKGEMHFHGIKKPIQINGKIKLNDNNSFDFECDFPLTLSDYNVEIPSLIEEKIAKEVMIGVKANYKKS